MAEFLRAEGHQAWTAFDAHLETASDDELIFYAENRDAVAVTVNKDFIPLARRLRAARVVYLRVQEPRAVEAMGRALEWLAANRLPDGRVLRVPLRARMTLMPPLPW